MTRLIALITFLFFSNLASADDKADVAAALDALHKAEASADTAAFLDAWAEDSVFLGTDASEAWSKEEFARDIGKRFAEAGGWTFDVLNRTVGIDGNAAWFKEVVRYTEAGFILRPTGTMIKRDGQWKIVQLHMGVPIPNDVYGPAVQGFMAHENGDDNELAAADQVLDQFHQAAADADWDTYFGLYTKDGIFLGTDVTERWTVDQFKKYASASNGWVYDKRERHLNITPAKNVIWFDEILDSKSYGTSQGSGLMIRTLKGWRIAQYHLVFPMPNDLAGDFTDRIKAFEAKTE